MLYNSIIGKKSPFPFLAERFMVLRPFSRLLFHSRDCALRPFNPVSSGAEESLPLLYSMNSTRLPLRMEVCLFLDIIVGPGGY